MSPDFEAAALRATETLIKYQITSAPVMPLPILKKIPGVLVFSFAEMAEKIGVDRKDAVMMFGAQNQDAATTVMNVNGKHRYLVAYNQRLPFYMLQRSLARELGHIVLGHDGSRPDDVRTEEAVCFARHLLCPRPLIRALQESAFPVTVELVGNITGCYERCLAGMRRTPATHVPPELNRIVREQFAEYLSNFLDYQTTIASEDVSALADFGSFMEGYEE